MQAIPRCVVPVKKNNQHVKFHHIDEIVWDALNQFGRTIPDIRNESGHTYQSNNPEHKNTMNDPIWHTKSEIDAYVERALNIKMSDYGQGTRNNALYNEIVKSIGRLRKAGVLIDWQKEKNAGAGIWYIDKIKFSQFVSQTATTQIANGDFYCSGIPHTISVREKQQAFKTELLNEYQICILCKFRLADYLIGAHIVPYHIMRAEEPSNSMNPTNGLLLCRLCDTAFENGAIKVGGDYYIDVSEDLKSRDDPMINAWLKPIRKKLEIKKNAKYPPDKRFLEWKVGLLQKRF